MIAKSLLLSTLATAAIFGQGSLTPPSGPAPSMKTLGQIEPRTAIDKVPFKISAPGAYYFTTNLTIAADLSGVTIDASQVTLDLNGFVLAGAPNSEAGIFIGSGRSDVAIRNGGITGCGVGIEASGASRVTLDSLRVTACGGAGASIGPDGFIDHSTAAENAGHGFRTGARSTVANSQARGNAGHGFDAAEKSFIRDCVATRNGGSGISAGDYSRVSNSSASDNAGSGLAGGVAVQFADCAANANQQHGINGGRLAFITRANTISNSQLGINAGDASTVLDSSASANGLGGIQAGATAHIANAKVDSNTGAGISVQKGSTVRDCSAQRNLADGIVFTEQCLIVRNNANGNSNLKGAAGLHARGTDNSIQENIAIANDRGIALETEGNMVIKNTSTNNSLNFFSSGDQFLGPVISTFENGDGLNPSSNFTF